MKKIESGCTAIILKSADNDNIGKIVQVGNYMGKVSGWGGDHHWGISSPIRGTGGAHHGKMVFFANEDQLQRLDDIAEHQHQEDKMKLKV